MMQPLPKDMRYIAKTGNPPHTLRRTTGMGEADYFLARYLRRSSATAMMMTRPCAM